VAEYWIIFKNPEIIYRLYDAAEERILELEQAIRTHKESVVESYEAGLQLWSVLREATERLDVRRDLISPIRK
jgi:hypothetical protein